MNGQCRVPGEEEPFFPGFFRFAETFRDCGVSLLRGYTRLNKGRYVAKNEDGEFELVLGNNQLLSVFVLMVMLLVVCFVGGYFLGRKATPVLNAAATVNGAPVEAARETEPTRIVDATRPEPKKEEPPPVRTAPQAEPETAKTEPVKAEPKKEEPKQVAKVEPPKPEPKKPEPKPETKAKAPEPAKPTAKAPEPPKVDAKGKSAATGQPIPGRIYLQLSATGKDQSDAMVDLLRRGNFPGFAAAIPDRPGMFRVLVGPLAETGIADMKAQLKKGGFPADEAIRRQF